MLGVLALMAPKTEYIEAWNRREGEGPTTLRPPLASHAVETVPNCAMPNLPKILQVCG